MRPIFGWLILTLAVVFPSFATAETRAPAPIPAPVTGTIVAILNGQQIAVPDIKVTLSHQRTGAAAASMMTDLSGRFGSPPLPPDTYQLCWSGAGWKSSCSPASILVRNRIVHLGMVAITPAFGMSLVRGGVALADGTPCLFSSQLFGIDLTAMVSAYDKAGTVSAGPIRANEGGQYVLPVTPGKVAKVRAACQGIAADAPVGALRAGAMLRLNLSLRNSRPEVRGFLPTINGLPMRRVAPGATVRVEAAVTDRDGDAPLVSWKTSQGSGMVTKLRDGTATWTLPRSRGMYTLFLLAADGKGGIRQARLSLSAETAGVFFSGLVKDPNGRPVPAAMVSVNGATIPTDDAGAFSKFVPGNAGERYVVTLSKRGYVPLSRIYDDSAAGTTWRLVPAQNSAFDPTHDIEMDERNGAHLSIAANSLVDEKGNLARVPVRVSIATLNPDKFPLPGDDGGMNEEGRPVIIDQYGGVSLEVRDLFGRPYALKQGARARLSIPIAQSRLRARAPVPSSIDMWAYDGVGGNWEMRGDATLVENKYVFDLFDSLTVVMGSGIPQISPGCLLIYGQTSQRAYGLSVRVTPQGSPPLPDHLISSYYNQIMPIPANKPATLALVNDLGEVVQAAKFFGGVNLDLLPNNVAQPGHPLKSQQFPYPTYCSSQVTFTFGFPPWQGYPGSALLAQNVPAGSDAFAQSYYKAVDPMNKRTTLGGWWIANGFNSSGIASGDTLATFMNPNELGVGTAVRCSQSADYSTTGCYATLYGNPDGYPGNADLAFNPVQGSATYTLAMERRAVETNPPSAPIVKFFAYEGSGGASPRVNSVDLDGYGPRFVPSACVVCHGGGYFSVDNNTFDLANPMKSPDVHASFREFDRAVLKAPSGQNMGPALDALNMIVRHGNPTYGGAQNGVAIAELIDGWYKNNSFDPTFVPNGWKGIAADEAFYTNGLAKSCRTCHVAFDSGVNWATKPLFVGDSDFHHFLVCEDNSRAMPNAILAYVNFWLSGRPVLFKNYLGWASCPSTP